MNSKRPLVLCALGVLLLGLSSGCDRDPESGSDGPTVSIGVTALSLTGVGEVLWDIEVVNGQQPTPDVVWRQRLASSRFGDGVGSVSYVGPCDASTGVNENTVRLWVVGVYANPVTSRGDFDAPPSGVLAFENPTPHNVARSR